LEEAVDLSYDRLLMNEFVQNISHSKNKLARYCQKRRNVFTSNTRHSCRILMKRKFCQQIFGKKAQISSFIKIHPVGAESFHADRGREGQTDSWT
jgi:hypothetical protein